MQQTQKKCMQQNEHDVTASKGYYGERLLSIIALYMHMYPIACEHT